MKLYMWGSLPELTDYYHDDGGLVIITDRDPNEAWDSYAPDEYPRKGPLREFPEADAIMEVVSDKEQVWVFPDAGCC